MLDIGGVFARFIEDRISWTRVIARDADIRAKRSGHWSTADPISILVWLALVWLALSLGGVYGEGLILQTFVGTIIKLVNLLWWIVIRRWRHQRTDPNTRVRRFDSTLVRGYVCCFECLRGAVAV